MKLAATMLLALALHAQSVSFHVGSGAFYNIPQMRRDFIRYEYSCVLGRDNPAEDEIEFWDRSFFIYHLEIEDFFRDFFREQAKARPGITDRQFAMTLFQCIHFRDPFDQPTIDYVVGLTGLTGRDGAVISVMNWPEFTLRVRPQLHLYGVR